MNKKNKSTKTLLRWLDNNLLFILASFLMVFIPLYPKLPVLDVLPGYIVRVRVEDFLILFSSLVWVIQIIRKKATWHHNLAKLIGIYLIIGLLSSLSAIFITKTVPYQALHAGKLFLHYFRRIEYFMLFFIMYSAIKSKRQANISILLIIPISLAISIYGYGQKYLYWPVYSTMNREFSKGMRLYLTEHARVPSTFGGHYDAAAYVVVVISVLLALTWFAKRRSIKIWSTIGFLALFWLLILNASRTSTIAYFGALTALAVVAWFVKNAKFALPRYTITLLFSLIIMASFGDLSQRFAQIGVVKDIKTSFDETINSWRKPPPENALSIDEASKLLQPTPDPLSQVTDPSDERPVSQRPLPGDVYENIPEKVIITDDQGNKSEVDVERTFSDNAYKYGLSAAIRLDTLWPQALKGLKTNPLLGSGYSTLTKSAIEVFTEAESTDNDYLRALGETGLLGFASFFAIIVFSLSYAAKSLKQVESPLYRAYLIGYVAGSIGLLINAIYIDVFEASKVAQTFWALTGIALILPTLRDISKTNPHKKK